MKLLVFNALACYVTLFFQGHSGSAASIKAEHSETGQVAFSYRDPAFAALYLRRLLSDSIKQALVICNGTHLAPTTKQVSTPKGTANVAQNCAEVAASPENKQNGIYFVYVDSRTVQVYCDLQKKISLGGDGLTEQSAGMSCKTINDYMPKGPSGIRWINPTMKSGNAFQIYCDFDSFGGGWSLVYSSRDDSTGNNNMQKGTRTTAHITSLDPGNANKRIAYDVFKAIESSETGYTEVMLTGYKDYNKKDPLVKMYFSKMAEGGLKFSEFLSSRIDTNTGPTCQKSYFGTELSSGKKITLSWEHRAFIAGAVSSGCAWGKEVWNEIDNNGGHILAPSDWSHAEGYTGQKDVAGACKHKGLFHIFIR